MLTRTENRGTDHSVITWTNYGYDALRRNNSVEDAFGKTTYDLRPDGQVLEVHYPDGRTKIIEDRDTKTDIPKATIRPDSTLTGQDINDFGQISQVSGAGVYAQKFGYNATTGQLASLTTYRSGAIDGAGAATTQWDYVPQTGQLWHKTYADASVDTYSYNSSLQLTDIYRAGDAEHYSSRIHSEYNGAGELNRKQITWGDESLVYQITNRDNAGRVKSITENDTDTRSFDYNSDSQLTKETLGEIANGAVGYTYYEPGESGPAGAIKTMTLSQGGTGLLTLSYIYDPVSKRLQTIQVNADGQTGQQSFTYGYLANTDLISSLNSNGIASRTWSYETDTGRLSQSSTSAGATTLYQANYGYDNNDQRTSESVTGSAATAHDWTIGYDALDQLQSVKNTSDNTSVYSYAFDGLGNRTDLGTVNNVNEYAEAGEYDARGNLTKWDGKTYAYDGLDRMVLAEDSADESGDYVDGDLRATFGYDSDGRRTWKKSYKYDADTSSWVQTKYLKFAYDGTNIIGTFDGDSGNLLQSYAWGQDMGGGIGGLLVILDYSQGTTPTAYFPIYDGNGNIVGLHDAAGAVVATYTYDPFGNQIAETGTAADKCPFRWQSRWTDPESGTLHTPYREYSPSAMRWLTRDPAAEKGGAGLYVYCQNDPINNIDPMGLAGAYGGSWYACPECGNKWHQLGEHFSSSQPTTTASSQGGSAANVAMATAASSGSLHIVALVHRKLAGVVDGWGNELADNGYVATATGVKSVAGLLNVGAGVIDPAPGMVSLVQQSVACGQNQAAKGGLVRGISAGYLYFQHSLWGGRQMFEGLMQWDFAADEGLSGLDAGGRFAGGLSQACFIAAGLKAGAPAPEPTGPVLVVPEGPYVTYPVESPLIPPGARVQITPAPPPLPTSPRVSLFANPFDEYAATTGNLPIHTQKQAGHIPGTSQYYNRIAQGKPTSAFFGEKSGNLWAQKAWREGTPTADPNIRIYKPGTSVGTGAYGGMQTQIRVVRDSQGRIHATPWGPEQ